MKKIIAIMISLAVGACCCSQSKVTLEEAFFNPGLVAGLDYDLDTIESSIPDYKENELEKKVDKFLNLLFDKVIGILEKVEE